mgnify:CR=1 FL=1
MTVLIRFCKYLLDGTTLILSLRAVSMFLGDFRVDYSFRSGFSDYGRDRYTACFGFGGLVLCCTLSRDLFLDW